VGKTQETKLYALEQFGSDGLEGPVPARQVGMHVAEDPPGVTVGAHVHQVELGMSVDQLDQLPAGVAGGSQDGGLHD
jgi:hypothetical protein